MMRSKKSGGNLKSTRKCDKRSGRGVMFENEELRMRTIEINAEVDRGQSDLRKLKRENETLKQQVWTLRDEYDKLENFVKTMEEESDEEDDEDEDDEDELNPARYCRSKMDEDGDHDDEEGNVETDNLENLQKVYSGKMQSVEYSLRQSAATMDNASGSGSGLGGGMGVACSSGHCGEVAGLSAAAYPATVVEGLAQPGPVRMCVPPEVSTQHPPPPPHPHYITEASPTSSSSSSHPKPLHPVSSADSYVAEGDHFNLDQLLDFASSFHYDRRNYLSDEPMAMALPTEEERPSSPSREDPTTDPGYSTVRRRSATVIEKLKGGNNTNSLVKEVKQLAVTETPEVSHSTTVTYTRSSYYFTGSLDGSRSQSLGAGLNAAAAGSVPRTPGSPIGPLYASSSASNIGTSSSLEAGLPLVSVYSPRSSLVRLNSIEPNTLMISMAEMPQLWDITTQEIIDELEQQAGGTLVSIRGVRVVGRAAYISLCRRDALQQLLTAGLTVRGGKVNLIDITRESVVLALTGVPHYIADATLVILLAAFGTIIGELERRFYKGVDTGERFVRMKLKKHVKLPKYVTVGGCRIVLTVHGRDAPTQLHVPDWGGKFPSSTGAAPPPTPHGVTAHHQSDVSHTNDLITPVSPDSGQCSEPSSSDKSCERLEGGRTEVIGNLSNINRGVDGTVQNDSRLAPKPTKTFSSRCIVNLKLPERPPASALPRSRDSNSPRADTGQSGSGNCPPVSTSAPTTPLGAGHVLRAGSLYRSNRGSDTCVTPASGGSPGSVRRHSRLIPSDSRGGPESPRPRPNSVVFEESRDVPSGGHQRGMLTPQYPHTPHTHVATCSGPMPLANGILRKASGSEQEALLPTSHSCTASIRNRLKIGRSMSCDSGNKKQQAEKEKRRHSRMESISENTMNDDASDITPLGAGAGAGGRRDSDKSLVSANSKSSSNTNKKKEPAIDLPWCGCWGNGCF